MGQVDQSVGATDRYGDVAYSYPGYDGAFTDEGLAVIRLGGW
jgi:hypothetical protein